MTAVLLDTCALIWTTNREPLHEDAVLAIEAAAKADGVFVSPVSAWEIGLAAQYPRSHFTPDARRWFALALSHPGVMLAPFTPDIAFNSAELPGEFHRDPGDRLLVATARALAVPIVTRDRAILAYGEAGHVKVIRC